MGFLSRRYSRRNEIQNVSFFKIWNCKLLNEKDKCNTSNKISVTVRRLLNSPYLNKPPLKTKGRIDYREMIQTSRQHCRQSI